MITPNDTIVVQMRPQRRHGIEAPTASRFSGKLRWIRLVLPALVLFACGTSTDPPTPPSSATPTDTARATGTPRAAGTAMPATVDALIASPKTPFDVRFEWDEGLASGEKMAFDWRQVGGIRRRDAQIASDTGSLFIESDFTGDLPLTFPNNSVGCDWYRAPDAQDVRMACHTFPTPLQGLLVGSLDLAMKEGAITRQVGAREIAGLRASCYEFSVFATGEICTDGAGVPLYFEGASQPGGRVQTITAVHVSHEVPTLVIPDGLPYSKAPFQFGPSFPVSRLQLPDWSN